MSKTATIKNSVTLFVFLLLAWGFYRFLFQLPEEVEELLVKPILWLGATLYFVRKEKAALSSLGITGQRLFPAIYFALALGIIFAIEAVVVNFVKYGGLEFAANLGDKTLLLALGLSFATAVSEEVTFRGFLFTRIWQVTQNEILANLITSVGWVVIHLPVTIFVLKLSLVDILLRMFLTFLFGMGSAFVMARTKNVFSSILLHVLWEWPIILFR